MATRTETRVRERREKDPDKPSMFPSGDPGGSGTGGGGDPDDPGSPGDPIDEDGRRLARVLREVMRGDEELGHRRKAMVPKPMAYDGSFAKFDVWW